MDEQIILNTGDKLLNEEWLIVFTGGSFHPSDLVLVKEETDDFPLYQYQANYIKYGIII